MSKTSAATRSPIQEARAFVHLLNRDEAAAISQEQTVRRKAKLFRKLDENEVTPLMAVIILFATAFWCVTLQFAASKSDAAAKHVLIGGLCLVFAIVTIYVWLRTKTDCPALYYRNWDKTLKDAGQCSELDELLSKNFQVNLIEATGRQFYVADLELAKMLAAQQEAAANDEARAQKEREACTRIHAGANAAVAA